MKINVHLIIEKGLNRQIMDETAAWFQKHPGPVQLAFDKRPVELPLDVDGNLSWGEIFAELMTQREQKNLSNADFIFLLTRNPNECNWFAASDPKMMRNGFGHVDDYSWVTSAPVSVICTHYILKSIFNALLDDKGIEWDSIWHLEPRGCFFDFCEKKADLNLKLRTADICGDCMEVFRSIGIPDALLRQTVEIMEACRPLALNTGQYRPTEQQFGRWPFPVAVTRHKIVQATNPLLKFLLLLDHFDCLVRYFYLTREILAGRKLQLVDTPSLGWWVDQLAHSLKGQADYKKVISIAQQEKVVTLRNESRGHGYIAVDPAAYDAEAQALEDVIGRIEDEMIPFFDTHRLLILRKTEPRNGVYVAEGEQLMGSHLLHPPFQVELPADPISTGLESINDVYVSDASMHTFHRISPYIRSTVCPTCHHPRILVTDGGDQFIDVFMGHRVRIG
jgi:hypothetical protein